MFGTDPRTSVATVVSEADAAMYAAKDGGTRRGPRLRPLIRCGRTCRGRASAPTREFSELLLPRAALRMRFASEGQMQGKIQS
jgi:hypothetical protein